MRERCGDSSRGGVARLLAELRRRRAEAEGRYQLAAASGWRADCERWAGAMLALSSLEEWALARFDEVGGEDERASLP
jgi:hypothetical protein